MPSQSKLRNSYNTRPSGKGSVVPEWFQANTVVRNIHLRFIMAAGATVQDQVINSNELILACGAVCTVANTTVQNIFTSVRLRKVEMWQPYDASITGTTYISLQVDQTRAPGTQFGATAASYDRPAHIVFVPDPASFTGQWHNVGGNDNLFSLTAQPGTTVDVWCDAVMSDPDTVTSTITKSATAATLGRLYYAWLDPGAVYFRPVLRTPVT